MSREHPLSVEPHGRFDRKRILLRIVSVCFVYTISLASVGQGYQHQWRPVDTRADRGTSPLFDTFAVSQIRNAPDRTVIIYITNSGELHRHEESNDRTVNLPRPDPEFGIGSFIASPSDADNLYAVTMGNLYHTINAGAVWTQLEVLDLDSSRIDVSRVSRGPFESGIVYLATNRGTLRYNSDSQSWTLVDLGDDTFINFRLTFDPSDPDIIYAGASYKSDDGGLVWRPFTKPEDRSRQIVVDPQDPRTLYAVGAFTLFRSANGGNTWTRLTAGLPSQLTPGSLVLDARRPQAAYLSTYDAGIFKSIDGGDTWRNVNVGLADLNVGEAGIGRRALYASSGGVFVSLLFDNCPGDCNATGTITVDELVLSVNIALGRQPSSECGSIDLDLNDTVTVDELVLGVRGSLSGCPPAFPESHFAILDSIIGQSSIMTVSGDGAYVYAGAYTELLIYERDRMGNLRRRSEIAAPTFHLIKDIIATPDNRFLYVLEDVDDISPIALSIVRIESDGVINIQDRLVGSEITAAAASPDYAYIYALTSNQILTLERASSSGMLLNGPTVPLGADVTYLSVIVSDDGRNLYVGGIGRIVVYARDASSGELSEVQVIDRFLNGGAMSLSPDGIHLYVGGAGVEGGMVVFERMDPQGMLRDVAGVTNLSGVLPGAIGFSPDGGYVYVVSQSPFGLALFRRSLGNPLMFLERAFALENIRTNPPLGFFGGRTAISSDGGNMYLPFISDSLEGPSIGLRLRSVD